MLDSWPHEWMQQMTIITPSLTLRITESCTQRNNTVYLHIFLQQQKPTTRTMMTMTNTQDITMATMTPVSTPSSSVDAPMLAG